MTSPCIAAEVKNDGGPAFPVDGTFQDERGEDFYQPGMSLRDWFAGMVLAGHWVGRFPDDINTPTVERMAEACYKLADAMLKEREK